MRQIKYIVLHCTAGPQSQSVATIKNYWKNVLKWKTVGYHHLIEASGLVHDLLPVESVANGVAGYNSNSIHISYLGGVDKSGKPVDNRTIKQKEAQILLVDRYKKLHPNAVVLGHRDFSTDLNGDGILETWEYIKSCPAFDVRDWIRDIGLERAVKPTGIVYKLNYPLVKDATVTLIQQALKQRGLNVTVDGVFGEATDRAVKAFQTKEGLKPDGIVGKVTAAKLNIKLQ